MSLFSFWLRCEYMLVPMASLYVLLILLSLLFFASTGLIVDSPLQGAQVTYMERNVWGKYFLCTI